MHPFLLFFFLFHVFAAAAPAAPSSSPSAPLHSSSVAPSNSSSSAAHSTSSSRTHAPTHSLRPHPTPTILPKPLIPNGNRSSATANPVHTREPFAPHPKPATQSGGSGQKPISIAFEVLGGLIASAVILSFLRCCHNYRKTPRRDRIADILHRHNLQRELEEIERNPAILRRPSLREPAPPYFPRPPSYEQTSSITPRGASGPSPADYSAVATDSPPSTPPMSERIPLPSTAVNPRAHPDLPSG